MQRSLTAFIALAAAAGFIGLAQAQTTSTTTTPSATAPSTQATAPSATAPTTMTATNPGAAPASPSMAPANPSAARPAPQASTQQPAEGNGFWSRNISQDEVRQAQQNLQAQGLYRGPVDGKVGSQMERALAQFQRQHGLRQTGTLDEQTMSQLGGAGSAMGSSMPPSGSIAAPTATTATAPNSAPSASTTTSPIGAGGTSTGTSTTAPSASPTQPVTR
jgi:peptidoglycan hydrolase-like protein with peptidoglycan-binding domain